MNKFKKLFLKLIKGKSKSSKVLTHLGDEEDWNQEKKELLKYIQSIEGQISKIRAKEIKKDVVQQNIIEEKELIKELLEKQKDIKKEHYEGFYSFRKLYFKMFKDKKFSQRLELVDKDDKVVFDIFHSFGVLPNGNIAIQGKSGEVFIEGESMNDIIYKPETLKNQIRRKRILLACDENFNHVPDLEKMMMPEMSRDEEDGEFNVSDERVKPFKQMIIEREDLILDLKRDKRKNEQTISDLRRKSEDLELAKDTWKGNAGNYQSELHIALKNSQEINKKLGQMDRDIIISQEHKQIAEKIKDRYDSAFDTILNELEDSKSMTVVRRAKDEIQKDIQWAKKQVPKEIHTTITEDADGMSKESVKPGEKMK